ncbi:hypothetical protein BDZ89DRAFT_395589 [Hymenopellis radicata]|nr:hypothetical protein BDZ89DRAFT_395589 [Hymenopellis radicata]
MGLTWLTHPVLWHSSRESGGPKEMLTDAENKLIRSKWHDWYQADWDYGQTTLAFFCTGIAIMLLFQLVSKLRARSQRRSTSTGLPSGVDRIVAACRYAAARQFRVRKFDWYSPPLGVVVALCGILTYLMALLLSARPYYWPNDNMGDSPPIATRAGWMSIAVMPFMIVFATKVNWIGILAGTSHEKLQTYHRWTAFFMWITSLVHTFPYIINLTRMGMMQEEYETSSFYWTGIAALIPQTYLVGLSWGIFRNRYYEIFKKLHFIASGIFMAALFIHVDFTLTSWDYFWATLGLYSTSWLIRVLRTHYYSGIGLPAIVETLPDNMLKVSVQIPDRLKWTPGQNVFIRFLGLGPHFFSSHPFTVASIPTEDRRSLDLVLRVKGGITRRLANIAEGKTAKSMRVFVDGPYGGLAFSLRDFDAVYLIAGGSGASFTVPLLLDLIQGYKAGMVCKRIVYIVAVKTTEGMAWMDGDLAVAQQALGDEILDVQIYVTSDGDSNVGEEDANSRSVSEKEGASTHRLGRPNLPLMIFEACKVNNGRVAFAACGPDSLLYDVRNAVADRQLAIADGFGRCKDVYLHTESFGW